MLKNNVFHSLLLHVRVYIKPFFHNFAAGKPKNSIYMEKIKAAIVGYGNIGKYVLEALETAPDFEVAGIVRRNGDADCPKELVGYKIVRKISELSKPDVAILCVPSRKAEEYAMEILPLGINTVDSFDIHTLIPETRKRLMQVAAESGKVAIISAGWDPGTDSIVRALM